LSFFNSFSKHNIINDLSILKVDLHSHIIPDIDDGSNSIEESLEIINELHRLGYKKIIATPHIMGDNFENTPEIINNQLILLQKAVIKADIHVEIIAAAEYYVDFSFSKLLESTKLLTFNNNYLLIELPLSHPPLNISELIFKIQTSGYKPVLAHPERYTYWYDDFSNYTNMVNREVYLQVNINSFSENNPFRKMAEKLAKKQLINFVGSDTHNIKNIEFLNNALSNKHFSKLLLSGKLLNNLL